MRPDHDHAVDPADVVDHHRRQLRNKNPATTAVNTHAFRASQSLVRALHTAHPQRPVTPPPRNVRDHIQVSIFAAINSPSPSRNLSQNQIKRQFTDLGDHRLAFRGCQEIEVCGDAVAHGGVEDEIRGNK